MDKVYVDVLAVFSREGELIPKAFVWEDGHRYEIDKISKPERCASRKAGGTGYRYTCMVEGKICHLFCVGQVNLYNYSKKFGYRCQLLQRNVDFKWFVILSSSLVIETSS